PANAGSPAAVARRVHVRESPASAPAGRTAKPRPRMKSLLPLMLCAASLTACAQAPGDTAPATAPAASAGPGQGLARAAAGTAEERAIHALQSINPNIEVDHVGAAPLPGFRE